MSNQSKRARTAELYAEMMHDAIKMYGLTATLPPSEFSEGMTKFLEAQVQLLSEVVRAAVNPHTAPDTDEFITALLESDGGEREIAREPRFEDNAFAKALREYTALIESYQGEIDRWQTHVRREATKEFLSRVSDKLSKGEYTEVKFDD